MHKTPHYRQHATGTDKQLGLACALLTICIWASWLISLKASTHSALTPLDLALMRYGIPAGLLLPFLYRAWPQICQTPKRLLIGIIAGAGLPFFFLSANGMHYAPVAHAGLLIPGTIPLFVTAIAVIVYREPLPLQRRIGLCAITVGVTVLITSSFFHGNSDMWKGDLLFLAASFFWAIFTICLRVAALPPLASTALLGATSSVLLLPLFTLGIIDSGLAEASIENILLQSLVQSLFVGLIAGFSYGFAINKIGAENTAALGSLTPVIATIGAIPLLGESLTLPSTIGIVIICCGVLFASGIRLPSPSFYRGRKHDIKTTHTST